MICRAAFLTLLSACTLLAGPIHAIGTRPTAQGTRPAPRPASPVLAVAATPAPAVALPQPPTDPRTVSVSGTVRGADGQPRPGVSVFPTTNPRQLAVTDAKGAFSLRLPATAGTVRLQADYFGVGSSRFEVDGQHPQPVDIVLGQ